MCAYLTDIIHKSRISNVVLWTFHISVDPRRLCDTIRMSENYRVCSHWVSLVISGTAPVIEVKGMVGCMAMRPMSDSLKSYYISVCNPDFVFNAIESKQDGPTTN